MGFLDKIKEAGDVGKNAQWRLGTKPAIVTLNDNDINIKMGGGEVKVFYKDIQQIEKQVLDIELKTMSAKYKLTPMRIKGGADLVDDLYAQILERMNPESTPTPSNSNADSPSFCSNCGQPLNGENFCPNCGNKIN